MKDITIVLLFVFGVLTCLITGFIAGENYWGTKYAQEKEAEIIKNSYYTIYPMDTIRVKKDHNYTIICE